MSKHYTPGKEEFHQGFEYEVNVGDRWISTVFDTTRFIPSNARVKFLDAEDVVSLDFKQTKKKFNGEPQEHFVSKETYRSPSPGEDKKLIVEFAIGNNHLVEISFQHSDGDESCVFFGDILNKTELKSILKKIGRKK